MKAASLPEDEKDRLRLLNDLRVLDTEPEEDLDELARTAAELCGVPIALISLVDEKRQWFKASAGLDAKEPPRELAFCAHAILDKEPFVVEDASKDERFHDNPLVTGGPNVRFYVGIPLALCDSKNKTHNLGTLCILDSKPRKISQEKIRFLKCLARQVELRLAIRNNFQTVRKIAYQASVKVVSQQETIANLSHEIKTPIHAILGFAELLSSEEKEKSKRKILEYIIANATQLGILVEDILELSKSKSDSYKTRAMWVASDGFVDEQEASLRNSRFKAPETRFCLESKLPAHSELRIDAPKIKQIITNLVNNAMKFTSEGQVSLNLTLESSKSDLMETDRKAYGYEQVLAIRVTDTGLGIPQGQINQIFEPFKKLKQSSEAGSFEGIGLGLAITRNLVRLLEGEIEVKSTPGSGSSFTIRIPCTSRMVKPPTSGAKAKGMKAIDSQKSSLKIGVVDDNELNRTLLDLSLKKEGYSSFGMDSGQAAITALNQNQVDLLLVDYQMPNMNGIELIEKIRFDLDLRELPIYIISAGDIEFLKQKTMHLNLRGCLKKPLPRHILLAEVEKIVAEKQAAEKQAAEKQAAEKQAAEKQAAPES